MGPPGLRFARVGGPLPVHDGAGRWAPRETMRELARAGKVGVAMVMAWLALAALPVPALPGLEAGEDASCVRHELQVKLFPGEPMAHRLVGWLCALHPYDGQTVLLTSPSGLSSHAYWDWPVEKDTYSFVRFATQAGHAVFNHDRMGLGESERPPAVLVNLETEAYIAHQLVGLLRGGAFGAAFGKVVHLGNSFSTFMAVHEAEVYHDVDGVVNTGVFVVPNGRGAATLFTSFYPAQLDRKFADQDVPMRRRSRARARPSSTSPPRIQRWSRWTRS